MYILARAKSRLLHKSWAQSPLVTIKGFRFLHIITSSAGAALLEACKGIASGAERAYPSVRITAFVLNPAFEARWT